MPQESTLHDAFIQELKDVYDAERQLTKALPKMARAASSDDLREAFEMHLRETQEQVSRLEQVFEAIDETVKGKHCEGMAGIIEEGKGIMEEDMDEASMDASLIAAAQRVEHYEIAAYGTLIAWARRRGGRRRRDGAPGADARQRQRPQPHLELQTLGVETLGRSERPERDRVPQRLDGRDAVFERVPGGPGHQVGGSRHEHELMRRPPPADSSGRPHIGPEPHAARRQKREACDDVVLRRVPVPADGGAGTVFVDQGHREPGLGHPCHGRKPLADRLEECGNWCGRSIRIRSAEERHTPPRDHAAHLELRERDARDLGREDRLLDLADESVVIFEALRKVSAK